MFRFPELTSGVIALSGVYSTRDFFGKALDGGIYFNSPLDYLAGLTDEGILAQLLALRLFVCCGRGAWEERMLAETHRLEDVNDVLAKLREGEVTGRAVLTPDSSN